MPQDFNPYREWLGLDFEKSPNHYELLSLPAFEADAARIAAAAERAATRVRSFRPGPHALAWSRLLDEVAAAKSCLCDAAQKAAYDRALQMASSRQIGPSSVAAPRSALAPMHGDLYPPGTRPPESGAPASGSSVTPSKARELIMVVERAAARLRDLDPPDSATGRPLPAPPDAAATSLNIAADVDPMAPVFVPVMERTHRTETVTAAGPADRNEPIDAAVLPDSQTSSLAQLSSQTAWLSGNTAGAGRSDRRRSPAGLLVIAIGSGALLAAAVIAFFMLFNRPAPTMADVDPIPRETAEENPNANRAVLPLPSAKVPLSAKQPSQPSAPAVPPVSPPVESPAPAAAPMSVMPKQPAEVSAASVHLAMPAPKPAPSAAPTRDEVAALIQSLEAVQAAIGEQDFSRAEQTLAQAQSLAKLPRHAEAVARLQVACHYAKQFSEAVETAVAGLQVGESFQVGTSTEVAFVAGSAKDVTLRIAGSNRRFALGDLPPQLALALSEFKLDAQSPQGRAIQGAYLLFHQQPDVELKQKERERARTLWEAARDAGADIEGLMPLLTEKYTGLLQDAADRE